MKSRQILPALALGSLGLLLLASAPLDAGDGGGSSHAGSHSSKHAGSKSAKHAGSGSAHGHGHGHEAEPAAPDAEALDLPGERYGHGVTLEDTTSIEDLFADPDRYVGKMVRVEGKITEVCPMAGCWINVKSTKGDQQVTFKVKDGVIIFPLESAGKSAVAEGIVSKNVLNLKRTRAYLGHLAEETGKPFDPASITEPMTLIRVMGTGAVVQ